MPDEPPFISDPVERYELGTCRHCHHTICRLPDRPHWTHLTLWRKGGGRDVTYGAHFLNRCQSDVPKYGYDAMPDDGQACGCYMCVQARFNGIDLPVPDDA